MGASHPTGFGKYQLLDRIAVGGMAELYRAKITGDRGFEKLVALKKIHPHLTVETELVNAFIDEAKLAAHLQHENIIQIYDFGSMEGRYFIAMEYLFGKDLRTVLQTARQRKHRLPLELALYIGIRVCAGLDYSHKLEDLNGEPLNIIHRDISPQNIFITYKGQVKIIDFGIAKAASRSGNTESGLIKGKVAYMSPEQARGETIDLRSDIFSTGILLYEMVTGRRMFAGETMQIFSKVREAEYIPPETWVKDLPPELSDVFRRALAREPQDRYQTCADLQSDLEACLARCPEPANSRSAARFMMDLFQSEAATELETMRQINRTSSWEILNAHKNAGAGEEGHTKTQSITVPTRRSWITGRRIGWAAALCGVALLLIFSVGLYRRASLNSTVEAGLEAADAGQNDMAVRLFTKAVAQKQAVLDQVREPFARALRGRAAALEKSDPQKAKALLLRSLDLEPGNIDGHFQLALLYGSLGDQTNAIHSYQKVLELNPRYSDAYFNLGYIYWNIQKFDAAKKMYLRVVELAPDFLDEALFNLAMVYEKLGDRSACLRNLEEAVAVNPSNQAAKTYLDRFKQIAGERS